MRLTPTPEQLLAIQTDEPKFAISAAAGSGKTFVLTQRYLRLVEEYGFEPDRILTITFTRKAAAEMKTRIIRMLIDTGKRELAQIAETGPIQTIHSFCERLLRENAIEAGLDPAFQVTDSSSILIEDEIRWILGSGEPPTPYAESLIQELAGDRAGFMQRRPVLDKMITDLLDKVRGSGLTREEMLAATETPELVLSAFMPLLHQHLKPELIDQIANLGGGDLLAGLRAHYQDPGQGGKRIRLPQVLNSCYGDALRAAERMCGLAILAVEVWRRAEGKMRKQQSFDFSMLESLAVNLLKHNEAARARVRRQYAAALVDESQDLNPVQYELIRAMDLEHLMFVGDVQQSIYGFRLAAPDLFRTQIEEGAHFKLTQNKRSDPGIRNFVDEFFSQKWGAGYLRLNGEFDLDQDVSDFSGVELWELPGGEAERWAAGIEHLIKSDGVPPGDIAVLYRTYAPANLLVEALRKIGIDAELVGGGTDFHERLVVRDIANLLECMLNPNDDFALFATLRSPFAQLTLDSIVLAKGEETLWKSLQTFEFEGEDAQKWAAFLQWFNPIRQIADRLSALEALSMIYRRSPYLETLAEGVNRERDLANARKLIILASEQPGMPPAEFAVQIRRRQELGDRTGDAPTVDQNAPVVKVLTLHKSKGLEFPVVIFPEAGHEPYSKFTNSVITDPRAPLFACKLGDETPWNYPLLHTELLQREQEEWLRLVYVGWTRARSRLIINIGEPPTEVAGRQNKKNSGIAKELRDRFYPPGGPLKGIVVRSEPFLHMGS